MERDDQEMVGFVMSIVAETAGTWLLINFHGAYKPDGTGLIKPTIYEGCIR